MARRRGITALGMICLATQIYGHAQSTPSSSSEFVAFRFDDTRVIAVVKVLEGVTIPRDQEASGKPIARYGFPYFEAPPEFRAPVPAWLQAARWGIHTGPGQVFDATVDQLIGGAPGCSEVAGMLLTVTPAQAEQFARVTPHYYVAEAQPRDRSDGAAPRSTVRALPAPVFANEEKAALESVLNGLMTRELPAIRARSAPGLERMLTSPVSQDRSSAAKRQQIDQSLIDGKVTLTYDVQAFQLDPSGTPTYFVRAEWKAAGDLAFAASAWLRGDGFELVESNTRAAAWLRMSEFRGKTDQRHLGLVLNVLDRDRDGWGEIVFAFAGYESLAIDVREWSPTGFPPSGIVYSTGC